MQSRFPWRAGALTLICALSFRSIPAQAHAGEGFGWVFNMLFGSPHSQETVSQCAAEEGPPQGAPGGGGGRPGGGHEGKGGADDKGILGMVNMFFCNMEKHMGITTTGSATKTMTQTRPKMSGGQIVLVGGVPQMEQITFTVSASIRAKTDATIADFTDNGKIYDYLGEVWVKRGSDAVVRAMRILWSGAGIVSSGHALFDPGAFGDGAGSAMNVQWSRDASGVGSVTAKVIHSMPSFEGGAMSMKMYALGTKGADGVLSARMVHAMSMTGTVGGFSGSHSFRLSTRINTVANTGGVSFEASNAGFCTGDGCRTTDPTASNDAPTQIFCFNRALNATSGDFDLSPGAPGCTVPNFPDLSVNDVNAFTATAVLTLGSQLWGGMAASPNF